MSPRSIGDLNDALSEDTMGPVNAWQTNVTRASQVAATESAANPEEHAGLNKIDTLKELTFRILREVQSMPETKPINIDDGIDFYAEVTRFEIDLIQRALQHTHGHQGRAARLLNLKITTLNSKIKHYGIQIDGFTGFATPVHSNGNGAAGPVVSPVG
jgi:DNA-binding NtrC family response regulator